MPSQLIVLGMHRSGTSGITRLLNLAGAYFGPADIATEPNEENPKGFWERRDVRQVCDGLLQDSGFDWWKLSGFDPSVVPDDVRDRWLERFGEVLADLDAHRPWVVKEPRLCVLLPLLRPLLPDALVVHVTREPLEVARSMHQRDGFPLSAALALWERYTVEAFAASADLPRLLVRHEDLMADPVAATARLVDDLSALGVAGLAAPDDEQVLDFISPALHRQHQDPVRRREELNGAQAELAAAIDDGSILAAAPPKVSDGARSALELLEALRAAEAGAHEAAAEADAAHRALERERAHTDERVAAVEQRSIDRRRSLEEQLRQETARLEREVAEARAEAETQARYREVAVARRRELGRKAEATLADLEQQLQRVDRSTVGRLSARLVALRQMLTPGLERTTARPLSVPMAEIAARRDEIRAYARQEPAPGVTTEGLFPTANPLVRRTVPPARRSGRPSVAVITWDVGHNPLGRANVMAEMLGRHFDVEIWGAQFERYGSEVWAPLRRANTPINVFPGRPIPEHLRTMERVAGLIEADAIWVCKPRLPSFLLGIDAKLARNRPLVLDVDDHELAFFGTDEGLTLEEVYGLPKAELELPFERAWTRLCDGYIDAADQVTVSNVALQERYGGIIVPHARDERRFDPASYDREAVRARLGIGPDQRLLLFGGTPRVHKGVVEVLEALDRLGDDRYRVLMFGTREFDEMKGRIGDLARWAVVLPAQSFDDLPELVAAADLACVVQDPSHPVSRYQLPAKVFDALAMGVPCLVNATPPLAPLVEAGVLQVLAPGEELHQRIADIFEHPDDAADRARRGRELFLEQYSYQAMGEVLVPMFERLLADPPPVWPQLVELAEAPRRAWDGPVLRRPTPTPSDASPPAGGSPRPSAPRRPPPRTPRREDPDAPALEPGTAFDVVMFWKQNDSGIYGRRQDMFLEELARSPRVGSILHFDNPISPEELWSAYRSGRGETADQRRLVVHQTLKRVVHRLDQPGVVRRTFVYGGRRSRRLGRPHRGTYVTHVRTTIAELGLGRHRPLVLWGYPRNDDLPALIDAIAPALVVTDVVDDNRTWYEPGTEHHQRIELNYREVLARSDIVLANCEPVAAAMSGFAPDVHLVPNGCEMPTHLPPSELPSALRGTTGPLLAYVGNLSARLDLDLLEAVARARPAWTIALVGSAHAGREALALGRLPNVHLLGVMPYREVRRFLTHVDVGLIPHLDNEMTRAMNPLKAFVYASAGVPAVATPIANLPDFGGLITIAEGAEAFIGAIEAHLAAGRPTVDPELLRPHSWPTRVGRVLELIDAELARTPPPTPTTPTTPTS